jgi:Uncharacterised protein family (UPF0149)
MRHWNDIAATLNKDEVYVPLLLEDEDGMAHGNDWARGFMRGMHMCNDGWAELMDDEEHDEDPKMRPRADQPGEAGTNQGSHDGWAVAGISVLQGVSAGQSRCPPE